MTDDTPTVPKAMAADPFGIDLSLELLSKLPEPPATLSAWATLQLSRPGEIQDSVRPPGRAHACQACLAQRKQAARQEQEDAVARLLTK